MRISEHLDPAAVILLEQGTIDEVIVELVQTAHQVYRFKEPLDRVIEVVQARERIGSTGLGGGVAIPHAQFSSFERSVVVFGRTDSGVDWAAVDGEPVRVFLLLLGPNNVKQHLAMLTSAAKLFKAPNFLERTLGAEDTTAIYDLVKELEAE